MLARCAAFLVFSSALISALPAQTASGEWIDVPFVAQPRDGCGAASLAMVMQYWAAQHHSTAGPAAGVSAIQRQIFSPRRHGSTPEAMEAYLRQNGFEAFAFSGTWSDLARHIGKGRPLIVALRPRGQTDLHYVVVAGIDPARNLVMMNDPADRKLLTEERADFEKDWSATHDWTLLALPEPHPTE
ncbi:MAG TPA: C39 family peptidase [Acidobacteriaceae bacterium]|jgi:predicted double-glycine peptidase|nr:C39 family peptidase [Acidobacteriaceae bacterium]